MKNFEFIGCSTDYLSDYLIFTDGNGHKFYLSLSLYVDIGELGEITCNKPSRNCIEYQITDLYQKESEWLINYYPESDKIEIRGNLWCLNKKINDDYEDLNEENEVFENRKYVIEDVSRKIGLYSESVIGKVELFDFIDSKIEDKSIQDISTNNENMIEYRHLDIEDFEKNVSFKDMICIVENAYLMKNFNIIMDKKIDEYKASILWDEIMNTNNSSSVKENSYIQLYRRNALSWVDHELLGYNDKLFSVCFVDRKTNGIVAGLNEMYVEYAIKGALASIAAKNISRKDSEEILIFGYDLRNVKYMQLVIALILNSFDNIKRITITGSGAIFTLNFSDFFKKSYHENISYKYPNDKTDDNAFHIFEKVNKIEFICAHNIEKAVKSADIIINVTPSSYDTTIEKDWIKPGTSIIIIGDDYEEYGSPKIEESIFSISKIIIDDVSPNYRRKRYKQPEIEKLIDTGIINESDIIEISQLISENKKGRSSYEEITLFCGSLTSKQKLNISKMLLEMSKERNFGDVKYL